MALILGVGIFGASLWWTNLVPLPFLPEQDISRSIFVAELPPG